jgi:hypothetical protein
MTQGIDNRDDGPVPAETVPTEAPLPPAPGTATPASEALRAAEDKVRHERLVALKAEKASGHRPPGVAHGRWLGDFLDQGTDTGLLPGEEKLLAAVARGEGCDLGQHERGIGWWNALNLAARDPEILAEIARRMAPEVSTIEGGAPHRHAIAELLIAETARWAKGHHKLAGIDAERLAKEPTWLAPIRDEVAARLQRELYWRSLDRDDDTVRIRGAFLRFLALGGDGDAPVHEKGLELQAAVVKGAFDVRGCRDVGPLWLAHCWFEFEPVFHDAKIAVLSLQGSRVPGLKGDRAEVSGAVFLSDGFTAVGKVRLLGARVGGTLVCIDGTFHNAGGHALDCDQAQITGGVFLSGGFTAEGEVRLLGAAIGGGLWFDGGTFRNAGGKSLSCDGAKITGAMFLRNGFTAEGEVRLVGTEIGGDLACIGGTFRNPGDDALALEGTRIDGTLWLGPGAGAQTPAIIRGSLNLQGAHANQVVDNPDFWPGGAEGAPIDETDTGGKPTGRKLTAVIALDGFTYDRFSGGSPTDAATRLRWLQRQPEDHRITDFRPQPYEQLVKVLREMGHEYDARKVAKARQDAERVARWHRNWPQKPLRALGAQAERFFLGVLAGYGYGSKRLIAMLLGLWLAGGVVYDAAERQGLMAPSNPIVFNDPKLRAACGGEGKRWTACPALPKEHTAFGAWFYSADVVTPIISFGLERDWAPIYSPPCAVDAQKCSAALPEGSVVEPYGSAWGWMLDALPARLRPWLPQPHALLWLVYWLQIVLGWGLSALLVAVLSGVMKKD